MYSVPVLVKPLEEEAPTTGQPSMTAYEVRRINARLVQERARSKGLHPVTAWFRCPWPCTRREYERTRDEAVRKWLAWYEKKGFTLQSRVVTNADLRRPSTRYSGDWAIPGPQDEVEIPVAALFRFERERPQRIEVPVAD